MRNLLRFFLVAIVSLLFVVPMLSAQEWEDPTEENQKLTASDAAEGDLFGSDVAVFGDVAIVGAPFAESAYVFRYDTEEEE